MNIKLLFIISEQSLSQITPLFPSFKSKGWELIIAHSLDNALKIVKKDNPFLIFSEAQFNEFSSLNLLKAKEKDPNFPDVIVLSQKGSAQEAKRFLEAGALDYWLFPILWEKVEIVVEHSLKKTKSSEEKDTKKDLLENNFPFFIGEDKKVKRAIALAKKIASSDVTVLIQGESGTGKEVLARFIHAISNRKNKPFVAVNCAALPVHLLESELFGYEKGAFTGAIHRKLGKFELANGGTMLLDEISEMDLGLQAKLLRVLQEKEIDRLGGTYPIKVDVRIIATTNRDLEEMVKNNKFREDLYYRINVIPIHLPPLRERGEDVIILAQYFIKLFCQKYSLPIKKLSTRAIKWLKEYSWPGNVRELKNYIERGVLLSDGEVIELEHINLEDFNENEFEEEYKIVESGKYNNQKISLDFLSKESEILPLHEVEKIMILKSLEHTKGNRTRAAELLGISVRTLRNKLKEYKERGEL